MLLLLWMKGRGNMGTYIFDFDGTLANSMPYFTEAMLAILERNNIAYSKDIIKIITPLGYEGTAKYYIKELGLDYTVEGLIKEMHNDLYPIYRDRIVLKPHVAEYLHALKKEGHSLNVLTASPYRMVAPVLKREMVYDLFDNVWSCEDFGMTKGQPEIYLAAVERVGGNIEDTVFFDDNVEALRTATKAGLFTVGVYDDASADYIEELKKVSNKFVYDFSKMRFT